MPVPEPESGGDAEAAHHNASCADDTDEEAFEEDLVVEDLEDLDLRLQGYRPADRDSAEEFRQRIDLHLPEIERLAAHHAGPDSFLIFYDSSQTWGLPGSAQLLAVHLTRRRSEHTFTLATTYLPLMALAQRWLAARGCPPHALVLLPEADWWRPADDATAALENRLATSAERYTLLDHYTYDDFDSPEITVLLHDSATVSAHAPYRLLVQERGLEWGTYIIREGAFPTREAARQWLYRRHIALPQPALQPPAAPAPTAERRGR
ncbi:glycosyl hydrolase [Streptomyces sp. YIM 98790]|uniref:glycosyl hydrolase n=1 Tax=Streptomyces sp. YIM 98790 TaxID=2689077 RepID=UPI00140E921D|nr:glycosyl hydrolase [Streptomyces sp. YIM 98790]